MTTTVATPPMTGKEIVDLTKKHTLFEWSAQSKVDPIPDQFQYSAIDQWG